MLCPSLYKKGKFVFVAIKKRVKSLSFLDSQHPLTHARYHKKPIFLKPFMDTTNTMKAKSIKKVFLKNVENERGSR